MTKRQLLLSLINQLDIKNELFNAGDKFYPAKVWVTKVIPDTFLYPTCSTAHRYSAKVCAEQLTLVTLEQLREQMEFQMLTYSEQLYIINNY